MKSFNKRREFIKNCLRLGAGCAFLPGHQIVLADEKPDSVESEAEKQAIDLRQFTYCGHYCSDECELFCATEGGDNELKRKVFKEWGWKEKYDVEFDPEIVFCYGCKTEDKPHNLVMKNCTVRDCALEKKLDACVQCKDLTTCKKELWSQFPEHKIYVEKLQKKYIASGKKVL